MTEQEAWQELRALLKKHKVELHLSEPPVSLEEIINIREGHEVLQKIDEVLK
ncbi:hypothetical protein ACQ46_gp116 [Citrobacter phage Moon]|uniref:Uncharacterized protein n=2 Tax=Moonvirus TaxID=1985329 RepID=A0A0K1LML4_9CAUD|nr:hypothetical protein ACQ46_gp116 [Citrobacter phage Moon]YP_009203829.1 hypothetical protein CPT_Merlin115 [Citrobacter phage Merlin]AIX12087.1 hypothetical protein CPT_Moon116 [Citrobacter phage Moon]AKU43761.1 hypothetical protein CPT_Merlin115 [Citrobacter phage Merlin]